MWLEKREYLESILIEPVDRKTLQSLLASTGEDPGPTRFADLIDRALQGDEFWRFEAIPGDKGFAVVRAGRVIDYCVIEINCV